MSTNEIRKIQQRFSAEFMGQPGIYGTRVLRRGGIALQVTVDSATAPTLPSDFEGVPIHAVEGGPAILAYAVQS